MHALWLCNLSAWALAGGGLSVEQDHCVPELQAAETDGKVVLRYSSYYVFILVPLQRYVWPLSERHAECTALRRAKTRNLTPGSMASYSKNPLQYSCPQESVCSSCWQPVIKP